MINGWERSGTVMDGGKRSGTVVNGGERWVTMRDQVVKMMDNG
jgi:hypothetical protein